MNYRVVIADGALASVERFLDYIAIEQGMPLTASRWWEKALARVETLRTMPRRCPLAPENEWSKSELRMLIVDRCLFIFNVDDHDRVVDVVKFRHGAQLPGPDLP
ncbi:MAG: type II toxin-antitoxin system RelE/ParE family toxin [Lacipirellulaceae bacterium]